MRLCLCRPCIVGSKCTRGWGHVNTMEFVCLTPILHSIDPFGNILQPLSVHPEDLALFEPFLKILVDFFGELLLKDVPEKGKDQTGFKHQPATSHICLFAKQVPRPSKVGVAPRTRSVADLAHFPRILQL